MASAARTAASASSHEVQAREAIHADQPTAGRLAAAKQIKKTTRSRIGTLPSVTRWPSASVAHIAPGAVAFR
jgi:hypothetical protein